MCTEIVQDWSSSPTVSWNANTTCSECGNHDIEARVRDGKHDPNGDSSMTSAFEIIPNPESIAIALNESNVNVNVNVNNNAKEYIIKNITTNASENSEMANSIVKGIIEDAILGDFITGAIKESVISRLP